MAYWGGGLFFYLFLRGGGLVSYGLVVQRPISTNPRLNFNPGFFMYLLKRLFRIILVRASNNQFVDKKNYIHFSFKVSGLISALNNMALGISMVGRRGLMNYLFAWLMLFFLSFISFSFPIT